MKKACALLFLSLLLTSCYPGTKVDIVNNTGQALTIVSMDTRLKETLYTVAINETIRIKVPYKLQIRHASGIWNYSFPAVQLPKNFREPLPANWFLEKYQVEKDGTLYVLLPGTEGPESRFPEQPEGFPIRPE